MKKSKKSKRKNPSHYSYIKLKSNPCKPFPEIYGNVKRIEAFKGAKSLYPGEGFYHNFEKGVQAIGLPKGSIVYHPNKRNGFRVSANSVVLTGPKSIYGHYEQGGVKK